MNEDRIWHDWPVCPQCGRPRQTRCPTCGTAGNDFPLAEYQALGQPMRGVDERSGAEAGGDSAQTVLLVCTHCDEAFAPRFYRLCPACGHDAGEGIDTRHAFQEPMSSRVLLAIYALVAVFVLLLIYFWSLFQGA